MTARNRRARRTLSTVAAGVLLLSACGQKGPLYLPTVPPLPAPPKYETGDGSAPLGVPDGSAADRTAPTSPHGAPPARATPQD